MLKQKVYEDVGDKSKIEFNLNQIADQEKRVTDIFGYNWPYDDFSLVEAIKIDVEIEVTK